MPKEAEEVEAARMERQAKGAQMSQLSPVIQEIRDKKSPWKHIRRLAKEDK